MHQVTDEEVHELYGRCAHLIKDVERLIQGHTDAIDRRKASFVIVNSMGAVIVRHFMRMGTNAVKALTSYPWSNIVECQNLGMYDMRDDYQL